MIKLLDLMTLLQQIMECEKEKEKTKYNSLVEQLPQEYKNSYHKLIQYGAMFILCLHTARRARESKNNFYF